MVQEPVLVMVDDGHRVRAEKRPAEMPERMRPRPRLEVDALVAVLGKKVVEPPDVRLPPMDPLPRPLCHHHKVHTRFTDKRIPGLSLRVVQGSFRKNSNDSWISGSGHRGRLSPLAAPQSKRVYATATGQ